MKIDKDFLVLLVGRVGQAILALVAIRVLTSLLGKEDVGLTYLIASLTSYFSLIFINPIGMYLNRKLHHWFRDNELSKAFQFLNGYFLAVAILSVPLVWLSYSVLHVGSGFLAWQICFLVFLNIYIGTWFQTLCPSLNMLEYRGAFVAINLTSQVVGFLASIAAIFIFTKSAFFWLLGILLGQALGAIMSWVYFLKIIQKSEVKAPAPEAPQSENLFFNKTAFLFYLPIAVTTALMWGQSQSYRLIVESKMGAESLATLAVGLGVATSIAGLVESLVNQYFYPRYYATISQEGPELRARAWQVLSLHSLSVYIPTMIFVAVGAQFLLRILVSSRFEDSLTVVAWGAAIEFFRMTTNLIYAVSQSEMKTRATILPYGLGAGVVVVGLWWVSQLEPVTTAYVPGILVLAGLFGCGAMFLRMKQILPIKLDIQFIGWVFLYSAPLAGMFLVSHLAQTLFASIVICSVFGGYLLWAIWRLQLRIEAITKTP